MIGVHGGIGLDRLVPQLDFSYTVLERNVQLVAVLQHGLLLRPILTFPCCKAQRVSCLTTSVPFLPAEKTIRSASGSDS